MKQLAARFPLFFSLMFVMAAMTACRTTSDIEVSRAYKVVGVDGGARYFEGQSETPRNLKAGVCIPQDASIQTASGVGNVVMLVPDEARAMPERAGPRPYDRLDKDIIYENSILKISKLTVKTVGGKKIRDTRLVLSEGAVLCDVGVNWPTDDDDFFKPGPRGPRVQSIEPPSNASYFEIGSGNMVVHAEHAVFFVSRPGIVRVLNGAVVLEFPGAGAAKDVFSGQQYDSKTGEITEFDVRRPEWPSPYWNWLRPRVQPPPAYQIPQRPF